MPDNRRKNQRIDLFSVDFARLLINGDFEIYGTISNISRGGLLVEMFPMGPGTQLSKGDTVEFRSSPEALESLLSDLGGTIVWVGGDCCGVRFDSHLEGDAESLRRKLNKHDFQAWGEDAA